MESVVEPSDRFLCHIYNVYSICNRSAVGGVNFAALSMLGSLIHAHCLCAGGGFGCAGTVFRQNEYWSVLVLSDIVSYVENYIVRDNKQTACFQRMPLQCVNDI